jgi:hypothetical protein
MLISIMIDYIGILYIHDRTVTVLLKCVCQEKKDDQQKREGSAGI